MNLQGSKEEEDPSGINGPRERRAPETQSPAAQFAFSGGGDGDLMMDLWADGMIGGAHCHNHRFFWCASSCSFQQNTNIFKDVA